MSRAKYTVLQILYWANAAVLFGFTVSFLRSYGFSNGEAGTICALSNLLGLAGTIFLGLLLDRKKINLYTEEAIAERIKGKVITKEPKPERKGVSLLIDIENCIKAQQSAGYERWAKIENLKRAARTMVFLDQNGIARYADLEQKIAALQGENEQTAATLKDVERRLSDMALLIKNIITYKELKIRVNALGRRLYEDYSQDILRWHFSPMFHSLDRIPPEYRGYICSALYNAMHGGSCGAGAGEPERS